MVRPDRLLRERKTCHLASSSPSTLTHPHTPTHTCTPYEYIHAYIPHPHMHTPTHAHTHTPAHPHTCTPTHLHTHMLSSDRYKFLVSGEAEQEVADFLASEHSLQEYQEKIEHFRAVGREIAGLDDMILFQMFHLECHDIKRGLGILAQNMVSQLVGQLVKKHIHENRR